MQMVKDGHRSCPRLNRNMFMMYMPLNMDCIGRWQCTSTNCVWNIRVDNPENGQSMNMLPRHGVDIGRMRDVRNDAICIIRSACTGLFLYVLNAFGQKWSPELSPVKTKYVYDVYASEYGLHWSLTFHVDNWCMEYPDEKPGISTIHEHVTSRWEEVMVDHPSITRVSCQSDGLQDVGHSK